MATRRGTKTGNSASAKAAPATKRPRARKPAAAAAGTAPEALAAPAVELTESERGAIERLAYSYWLERGCQGGSAQEDWFRAEEEILRRRARAGEAGGDQ